MNISTLSRRNQMGKQRWKAAIVKGNSPCLPCGHEASGVALFGPMKRPPATTAKLFHRHKITPPKTSSSLLLTFPESESLREVPVDELIVQGHIVNSDLQVRRTAPPQAILFPAFLTRLQRINYSTPSQCLKYDLLAILVFNASH